MKTPEKLAAGWLLTLGFMFLTISVSAVIEKSAKPPVIVYPYDENDFRPSNTLEEINDTILRGIIYGIPSTILGGWLALGLYRQNREDKKALNEQASDRIQSQFYQMLQQNQGRITVLGFAMQSQLPAATARQYLDEKAKEFNANFKVNEEGAVSYHFDV